MDQHRQADTAPRDAAVAQPEAKKLARLEREAQHLRTWLAKNKTDRKGAKGAVRLSNRTERAAYPWGTTNPLRWPPARASSKATLALPPG